MAYISGAVEGDFCFFKKWGEEGKKTELGGRKKGGMGRKEEDAIISFEKDDLKSNHSASLSEEMDMTEREENIFGLDFSRGHSYKIAGRDIVSKKGGAKNPSSFFYFKKKDVFVIVFKK